MKFGDFIGLSGKIAFDTYGRRTNFYLDVLELQATGLEPIGAYTNVTSNVSLADDDYPMVMIFHVLLQV